MSDSGTYRIRPAGRHILTIGRDLIQNNYAAVIEIVKNAYDADSTSVNIEFKHIPNDKKYSISITDYGHGMSRDTVINKWMVPSTTDKFQRKKSPSGRTMQGSKGIGRYAASVLGKDLLLETTTPEGEVTTVYVEWSAFEEAEFLDDVELLIETKKDNLPQGTKLTITESDEKISLWNKKNFKKLVTELKKMLSPVSQAINTDFNIFLTVEGFSDELDQNEEIEPFPLLELFDYKISGRIDANGKGVLTYFNQKARNATQEDVDYDFEKPTGCGELFFDIRIYDREKEAIESLIARGLKDEKEKYFSNKEAKILLNTFNGIGVYRNGFRIRPLGDPEFDWLMLNKKRIQNPALRIGSDQVIGYVLIQSEEQSKLIEKSARDGLKENLSYGNLMKIAEGVIKELEERRFSYRKITGLGRRDSKTERDFERIYSFDKLKHGIQDKLRLMNVNKETTEEFIDIINKDEIEKGKIIGDIYREFAIYQGQATLGKIINVILHEGRSPLNYFKNQIPNLDYWYQSYIKTKNFNDLEKFMPIAEGVGQNSEIFVNLFERLDPLASRGNAPKKPFFLKKHIEGATKVFEKKINELNIKIEISGSDDFCFQGWYQDIYAIFVNLIDNSIYWIGEKNPTVRNINIEVVTNDNMLSYIDYKDSGPGIEPTHIDSEVIFDPQFTTKLNGTGLGLAIAGESAARNGLELKAYKSDEGAYFRLQPKEKD